MVQSIYVALDFPDWKASEKFLTENELHGVPVKVGMELFYREGLFILEKLKENNHPIFLDLKLHDIPTTVHRAMRNLGKLEVDLVNVHALGGKKMIHQAKEGLMMEGAQQTKLLAVTILTSTDEATMQNEMHLSGKLEDEVQHLATMSKDAGADGVVCSVHEAYAIKETCGSEFLTVTPGIRLEDSAVHDQVRVATPSYAVANGSDVLVIGRSITQAANPKLAYERAIREIGKDGIK